MANIKTLPHNDDAERSVLGAILIDKNAIVPVSEVLISKDFYSDMNGIIYGAMMSLYEARKPIDLVTLTEQLKKSKLLKRVDSEYLTELVEQVPTAANVTTYANMVKEDSTKRRLITAGTEIAEVGYQDNKEVKEMLDKAESAVFSISQGHLTRGFIPLRDTLADSFDRIDELQRAGQGMRGVRTGFHDLDHLLSGMQKNNLIILAARPGQGKTAFMLNIAQNVAVKNRQSVGIFSLEMSKEELVDRMLVGQADVDAWRLKTGKLSESDFSKLSDAMGQLADAPIFIDDTPGLSLVEMRSKARRLQMEHDLAFLVVDYLQLLDPGKKYESRVQEVGVISKSLKNLARELGIPVLSASQLSRAVEHRTGDKRPVLADLRESGSIEQDADVVMFIHRPEAEAVSSLIPIQVIVAKHRNGAVGDIDLMFQGNRVRFMNVEKNHDQASA